MSGVVINKIRNKRDTQITESYAVPRLLIMISISGLYHRTICVDLLSVRVMQF